MGKAKIISVINYKGGVGKTVSAFNIGIGLNFFNHHSVLLIDLDPQCSLSTICMKAMARTNGTSAKFSDLKEEETINYVFKTYLNRDILDYDLPIDLEKLIKKDFYKGDHYHLKDMSFIPATMLLNSRQGIIAGLEDIDSDIKKKYGDDSNSQLKRLSMLAKFIKDTKINEFYDFIIFDCPPTNNFITQNALFVSDYYIVPTIMDELGIRGANHVRNIIEKREILSLCNKYDTLIRLAPDESYLSFLKNGTPTMLGIVETMRKSNAKTDQFRQNVERNFPEKLFDSVIYNAIDISRQTGDGGSCYVKQKGSLNKNPTNVSYGNLVYEILSRLNVQKNSFSRDVTEYI